MLNLERINEIDISGMYKVYDNWPKIAQESFNSNLEQIEYKNLENIVFAGMGGSGTIGDIFSSILSRTDIHVSVVKGYLLPNTVNENTLVVTISVSGNTVETLNVLNHAKKFNAKVIAFSSGGKIEEYCKKNTVEHRHIEQMHSPRASFPVFLYSILKILEPIIPIKNFEVMESIKQLEIIGEKISSQNLSQNNKSLSIAKWINEMPIIYYPAGLQSAAIRFKNSLQENAKMHVIAEDVVEACHNGIVAWEKKSKLKPIIIEGKNDYIKTKERWGILKEFFKSKSIDYYEIMTQGESILTKIVCLVYVLDYASIYKGVLTGINPSPVKSIDFVKERIDKVSF